MEKETCLAMGRVKRGSMAGEAAYLQKNHTSSWYYPWRKRWLKGCFRHTKGSEMTVGSRQMYVLCYLFPKLFMMPYCLETVGRKGYEASMLLRSAQNSVPLSRTCLRHILRIGM